MNAGVNANHSRQEEGMKIKREKKKGSEKERQVGWVVGRQWRPSARGATVILQETCMPNNSTAKRTWKRPL